MDSDDSEELLISLQTSLGRFAAAVSDSDSSDHADITSRPSSTELLDLENTLSRFITISSDSSSDVSLEIDKEKSKSARSLNRRIGASRHEEEDEEDQTQRSSSSVKIF